MRRARPSSCGRNPPGAVAVRPPDGALRSHRPPATFPAADPRQKRFSCGLKTGLVSWSKRASRRPFMADEHAVPPDADLLGRLEEALFEIRRVIAGQEEMLERVL